MEPRGFSGGLLLGWSNQLVVRQVISNDFSFESEFEALGLPQSCWGVFVYANGVMSFRRAQLSYLVHSEAEMGRFMVCGEGERF